MNQNTIQMAYNDTLDASQMRDENYDYRPAPEDYIADSGLRLANYIADYFIRGAFFLFLIFLEETYNSFFFMEMSEALLGFMLIIGWLGYYPLMEFFYGKTVGKMLTGTSVVRIDGDKITFLQAIGRTLCRMIPFEAFSFLGSRAVGWHDNFSDTRVVKDKFLVHQQNYFGE